MFSRTGSSDFPTYLKCMISGPPKAGKTTLLGTVPNIIIADTEPHANNLQSVAHLDVPFKAIHSLDDLRQLLMVLSQDTFRQQAAQALGMPAIEAVAIDTLDTLQQIMKRERMRDQRQTQFLRDDWSWLKEEMTEILQGFLSLPMHVFLVVHTKTKEVGTEKNPRTIYLPGLEGSLAESIAGMVGYSLLSFRKEEIRPDGLGKFTKYWLRAEGDETYEFLGNRAAGRLPDIIEPDFKHLYDAAMAGRPTRQQPPVSVQDPAAGIQTTGQTAPGEVVPAQQAAATAPVPSAEPAAQNPGQPTGTPTGTPPDSEPVNVAALGFVKKVYDSIGQSFPEEKIKALNLGQARGIVRTFKALQKDEAEGKMGAGETPTSVMTEYLGGQDLLPTETAPQVQAVEPKVDGTIDQVKAYATDLAKVQEAWDLEVKKASPRGSLMQWLANQGAKTDDAQLGTTPEPTPEVSTPVQNDEPVNGPEAVTPTPASADASSTEDQAIDTVKEGLGGEVLSQGINPDAKCEECGNTIDDVDLAQLGKSRFDRVLCVTDYIAETKKPRTTVN